MVTRKLTADQIHAKLDTLDRRTSVAGYVVLDASRQHVATIRFGYPRDGAGRLQAFCADYSVNNKPGRSWDTDTVWQYGTASGFGYDKGTAALAGMHINAFPYDNTTPFTFRDHGMGVVGDWSAQLRAAGFDVIQAI